MKKTLLLCVLCVTGFISQIFSQVDTFSLQYQTDTLVVSDHPLSNQFRLKHNSVYVSRDAKELAGTFDDPSRVLKRHVGISTGNDQANGIIYHGLPSDFTKWTIHGAEIVNPNHTSNAGTFSDISSQSAGGVLGIPFDVINTFSFHANTHVENTPTTVGGVANFNFLSESDNFFKVGLLGLELGTQSKNSKIPIKTHFRYSTVGLLGQLGVDFGGEKIAFSDGFFQAGLSPQLNFIAGGGLSSNIFRGVEDIADANFQKDLTNVDFNSYFLFGGFVYDQDRIKHSLIYSRKEDTREATSDSIDVFPLAEFENYKISYAGQVPIFSEDIDNFDVLINGTYNYVDHNFPFSTSDEYRAYLIFALRYVWFNDKYSFSSKIGPKLEAANQEITPELSFIGTRQFEYASIELSTSLSTQEQNAEVYGHKKTISIPVPEFLRSNKSFNASLTYKAEYTKNEKVMVNLFYHHLFHLPVNSNDLFPFLTLPYNEKMHLFDFGKANNYGIEIMYDRLFDNGLYFNTNLTLFQFKLEKRITEDVLNPTNNFNFMANVVLSKSWKVRDDNRLSANAAFHFRGGDYDYFNSDFPERLSPYSRLDLRVQYEFKKSILSLDIQNLLNRKNDGFYYFDQLLNENVLQQQLGLIPVFSWKRIIS